ncbi:MAG: hypothetical protein AB1782_04905 [Cyanobacteriota bacterium]
MINVNPIPSVRFEGSKLNISGTSHNIHILNTLKSDCFSFSQNNITFNGSSKSSLFNALPPEEKKNLNEAAKSLMQDANAPLTLIGAKPGSLVVMSKNDGETIRKHRNLLDSNSFRFVVETKKSSKDKQHCNVYIVNVSDQMEIIENNIDYLRYRFNDNKLTSQEVFNKLFSDTSPIFNINNNHDLVGMVIGFPVIDSIMFRLGREITQTTRLLNKSGQSHLNASKFLNLLSSMFKQSKPEEVQSIMDHFGIKNPETPISGTDGAYIFETWDKNRPDVQEIMAKVPEALKEAKIKIQTPEDVLNLLFTAT